MLSEEERSYCQVASVMKFRLPLFIIGKPADDHLQLMTVPYN